LELQKPYEEARRKADRRNAIRRSFAMARSPVGAWLKSASATSPAAWRQVHLDGRYTSRNGGQAIDLDAII